MPVQKLKSFLFNFFHFNKQERNGVFVLCVIIVVLFAVRLLLPYFGNNSSNVQLMTINIKSSTHGMEENKSVIKDSNKSDKNKEWSDHKTNNQLFVFNPNTITEVDAQKLGFSKKLSSTLINFRNT